MVKDKTNWHAVDALSDADIASAVANDPDAAPLEAEGLRPIGNKQSISIRLSPDILDYFRSSGKGWQTRLESVLREYMERMSGDQHKHS